MPKSGFRAISVTEKYWNEVKKLYNLRKTKHEAQGIRSASAYYNQMMKDKLTEINALKKAKPRFEKIAYYNDKIILRDNSDAASAPSEIKVIISTDKKLFCDHCIKTTCQHVGFCYSLHEIYPALCDDKRKK